MSLDETLKLVGDASFLDDDGDGKISPEEIRIWMHRLHCISGPIDEVDLQNHLDLVKSFHMTTAEQKYRATRSDYSQEQVSREGQAKVQINGTGKFLDFSIKLEKGVLTMDNGRLGSRTSDAKGCAIRSPKHRRNGQDHVARIDLDCPDSAGETKYVLAFSEPTELKAWMEALGSYAARAQSEAIDLIDLEDEVEDEVVAQRQRSLTADQIAVPPPDNEQVVPPGGSEPSDVESAGGGP